jgi:hypothetical protein
MLHSPSIGAPAFITRGTVAREGQWRFFAIDTET